MRESIVEIAQEASKRILEVYRSDDFEETIKDDESPLTRADLESHRYISRELESRFPYPVLSEEDPVEFEVRKHWGTFWLVDPLDGTKDFIARNDEFTVNIALIENKTPVLGVIAVPALGVLYHSVKGEGVFKEQDGVTTKIQCRVPGEELVCADSRFHSTESTKDFCKKQGITKILTFGSAMKLCKIAEGVVDVYPRFAPTKEWDTAAGQSILNEAGGKVVDVTTGEEIRYNRENIVNNHFIASSNDLSFI